MTKVVKTDKAPGAIGPYSQGIDIGNMIFFSGQIPLDPETGVAFCGASLFGAPAPFPKSGGQ